MHVMPCCSWTFFNILQPLKVPRSSFSRPSLRTTDYKAVSRNVVGWIFRTLFGTVVNLVFFHRTSCDMSLSSSVSEMKSRGWHSFPGFALYSTPLLGVWQVALFADEALFQLGPRFLFFSPSSLKVARETRTSTSSAHVRTSCLVFQQHVAIS